MTTAIADVLSGGWYILGEQVSAFEREFAAYCGANHAVGVASGTDALLLALKAFDIGPGDEVITVPHTAVATVTAIVLSGAQPVFVDIDPKTCTLDPNLLHLALTPRTRAIIPVHLYGRAANLNPILKFAQTHGLIVIEDCAQAHGSVYDNRRVGSLGDAGAFSFYPTKNLGAFGDGGAIVCRDQKIADRLQLLRQYGWKERYISEEVGFNSRLDELQAAILRIKLHSLEENNNARRHFAAAYIDQLAKCPLTLPDRVEFNSHIFHLFVIQVEDRQALMDYLQGRMVGTAIHYPVPIHLQPAYQKYGYARGSLPVTEKAANRVLSLPMYPQLSEQQIDIVTEAICTFYGVN